MQIQKKIIVLLALSLLLGISAGGARAMAADGAESYNYSYWGLTTAAPAAYQANALWNGESLGAGAFKEPSDFHVTGDRQVYVLDSGHNRVVVLNDSFQPVQTISSFLLDGKEETFNNPQGLFVTDSKELVVADTGNKRIVHLDRSNKLVKIIAAPKSDLLSEKFDFQPVRVVVDKAQRIYAMSAGVYDGFMEFSPDGTFTSFVGANRVSFNPTDYLWKMLSTKAQRSQMVMFTPTEFTNLDIDQEGFIYATNGQDSGNVKKLNAQGNDILRRNGYFAPEGDIRYMSATGPSRLIDIDVGDSEMYSLLDAKRGRIFTYDGDGHLLYVFGGIGNQMGQFNTPVAIERLGDEFLVLDKALGEITVFQTTEYGRTLNEAVRAYYSGDEEQAFALYQETISMNANLEFAYAGIGKALLRQGDYREAMKYFKKSMDQKGYSKAFLLYRKEVLREYFPGMMTGLVMLIVCWLGFSKYRKRKGGKKGAYIKQRAL
ncbi:hypothetical protein [Paenibacillus sp. MMO-58]|uniref:hypothetical protein n=1 Tax=Paenibacillus sp. MMO-58 TaxID=3081290 RepID=UPI003016834F